MAARTNPEHETAGEIIRRRLGPQPAFQKAVAEWLAFNRANPVQSHGLASQTKDEGNLRGGAR